MPAGSFNDSWRTRKVYEFARGPLVWIAFILFIGGGLYQLISMLRLAKKDKVVLPYFSF